MNSSSSGGGRIRNNNYHDTFDLNQYYNAVEDEQIYMDEYTTLLHRYNDFIVNGNAMFTRLEQTLRENLARTLVRQSFYYHRLHENRVEEQTTQPLPPAPLNSMRNLPDVARERGSGHREPNNNNREPNNNNNNNTPRIPSTNRVADIFPRLLSRYFANEHNQQAREINNDNIFSMLYTFPLTLRTNPNGGGNGGSGTAGPPTNEQIANATLNTVFGNILTPVNATCPISRDEFNDESEVTMIRGCSHIFNRASLREWFVHHSTCPMCRGDIRLYRSQERVTDTTAIPANMSIDSVDENHVTFSYDVPHNYTDSQIYNELVNTISAMTSNQRNERNERNDDEMD